MKFDSTQMMKGFERMKKSARDRSNSLAKEQGNFFLRMAKKLGWQVAPSKEELTALAAKLGFKLLRKKGVTPAQELARRIRARGTFARGWVVQRIESESARIRIWIGNPVKYAGIVEDQKHTAAKAADIVGGSFKRKLDRLAKQCTGVFGS